MRKSNPIIAPANIVKAMYGVQSPLNKASITTNITTQTITLARMYNRFFIKPLLYNNKILMSYNNSHSSLTN